MKFDEFKRYIIRDITDNYNRLCYLISEELYIEDQPGIVSPPVNLSAIYSYFDGIDKSIDIDYIVKSIYAFHEQNKHRIEVNMKVINERTDQIILVAVNNQIYHERLCEIPHIIFLDIIFVYRYIVSDNEKYITSVLVDNNIFADLNLSSEQLYNIALENILRFKVKYMGVGEAYGKLDESVRYKVNASEHILNYLNDKVYWISNSINYFAANIVLNSDILHGLAQVLCCSYYIMMLSDHIFIIPRPYVHLTFIFRVIILDVFAPEDSRFISKSIYYYDMSKRVVSIIEQ